MYRILEANHSELLKIVDKYNRKSHKLNMSEIKVSITGEEFQEVSENEFVKILLVEVEGQVPVVSGWDFIATIDHSDSGNIIHNISGQDVPEEYRSASIKCDHCHTNRYRKNSYILRNRETGEYKQIGRNCLADYLRCTNIKNHIGWIDGLLKVIEHCKEAGWQPTSGNWGETHKEVECYLAHVCRAVEVKGWVSGSRARDEFITSTASRASDSYGPCPSRDWKAEAKWRELQPTPDNYESAKAIIDYIRQGLAAKESKSEFEHNLVTLFQSEYFHPKNAGYIASAYIVHRKHIEDTLKKEKEVSTLTKIADEYVGQIGSRLTVSATILSTKNIYTDYGVTTLHCMIDQNNHMLIWFASTVTLEVGQIVTLKATIKEHREYSGQKQTVLTRCKVIEPAA
ncbi:hypothetical protein [Sporomusa paucivorans]|uniref:hypothetical protein n=1 Tax=Sporomusa paucivorans TaxID=2376 RepID=UPI003570A791